MAVRSWYLIVLVLAVSAFSSGIRADTKVSAIPRDQRAPTRTIVPGKGIFLVAKRDMSDPRFRRTVVLLLAHGDGGTLGLIINRRTELPLSRALPDLNAAGNEQHALFFGGPVGLNTLIFLVRSGTPPQQSSHVMADVYYSADRDTLEAALNQHKQANELRMYLGHSGWAPGQLAAEIARGDWLLVGGDSETVFEENLDAIWWELIERGPPPGIIVDNGDHGPAETIVTQLFTAVR